MTKDPFLRIIRHSVVRSANVQESLVGLLLLEFGNVNDVEFSFLVDGQIGIVS
jgi:hypothetical protein